MRNIEIIDGEIKDTGELLATRQREAAELAEKTKALEETYLALSAKALNDNDQKASKKLDDLDKDNYQLDRQSLRLKGAVAGLENKLKSLQAEKAAVIRATLEAELREHDVALLAFSTEYQKAVSLINETRAHMHAIVEDCLRICHQLGRDAHRYDGLFAHISRAIGHQSFPAARMSASSDVTEFYKRPISEVISTVIAGNGMNGINEQNISIN